MRNALLSLITRLLSTLLKLFAKRSHTATVVWMGNLPTGTCRRRLLGVNHLLYLL
jgi:hypothetical protein